ncbi:phosphotransferase [Brevibacterium siliguriense]|uniref:phosphotransferase n=1 Tax=Brevibacterium siliguriense TaxID=1136497 RepID=UPI0012FD587D|nr:phosphotransferase [Brevibacterium siliguriense]
MPSTADMLPSDLREVMSELSDLYGVRVERPTLFKGEFDVNVRFVDPTHGMLLAKVSADSLGEEMLRWQETVLEAAAASPEVTFRTPTILPALDGRWHVRIGTCLVRVVTWISGRLWNENPSVGGAGAELLHSLGQASARLTLALDTVEMPPDVPDHDWMIERGPLVVGRALDRLERGSGERDEAELERRVSVVRRITAHFAEHVLPRLGALPRAVIHHDLHDANVVLDETGTAVAGVIDFNDAVRAPRISDLAISGAYAMLRRSDPEAAFRAVVDGYLSVLEPEPAELEVVGEMALMRLCMNWAQWRARAVDAADSEYALQRSAHTWPLIAHLAEAGTPH